LREEVEALLGYEEQSPEFLESPALEILASALPGEEQQATVERLPAGSARDPEALKRFKREALLSARLLRLTSVRVSPLTAVCRAGSRRLVRNPEAIHFTL
jgi:hypothetical protein